MLTYYQPFLLPFLRHRRYAIPQGILQTLFLSFEDALWAILKTKKIPHGSVILVPDFYCTDVVENIRNHGYIPVMYPLDDNFQISKSDLKKLIHRHEPGIVILFHACGITNAISRDAAYIASLCAHMLVIEDCVHRLINPSDIRLIHDNHILIDSLRKVSPLSGSFVYSRVPFVPSEIPVWKKEYPYIFMTRLLYGIFRYTFLVGVFFRSYMLITFAHRRILSMHDDRIGDSVFGYGGDPSIRYLHRFIDFTRLETLKRKQVAVYAQCLQPSIGKGSPWFRINIPKRDWKHLHVYPLGLMTVHPRTKSDMECLFEKNRMPVWFKFPDAAWSQTRSVLFLPLGYHVTDAEIRTVCSVIAGSVPVIR